MDERQAELNKKDVEIKRLRSEIKRLEDELAKVRNCEDLTVRYGNEGMMATAIELEQRTRELAKVNQELEEAHLQLVQSAKMAGIGTIAGGIAHEINNPLVGILTNVQILMMDAEKRTLEDNELLVSIERSAKRCKDIVQVLLKYTRKAGPDRLERVNINDVVGDTCSLLEEQLKKENIEIEKRLSNVGEIYGSHTELQQVFANLILNAKDAIRKARNKGTIIVRTVNEGSAVEAQVIDDGCGIARQNLERVFDPFFTTKGVGEGTGLGLSIASKIMEAHKGQITVASEEGKGTTFSLRFPLRG